MQFRVIQLSECSTLRQATRYSTRASAVVLGEDPAKNVNIGLLTNVHLSLVGKAATIEDKPCQIYTP